MLSGLLAEKRFVTIYPLRAWRGERKECESWLPSEVVLVSGKGREELETFCRERASVYEQAVVLSDVPPLREWLPKARLLGEGMGATHEIQL